MFLECRRETLMSYEQNINVDNCVEGSVNLRNASMLRGEKRINNLCGVISVVLIAI